MEVMVMWYPGLVEERERERYGREKCEGLRDGG